MLIAAMLGGALFGFLAAGVVGWLILGSSATFAFGGAVAGLVLVAMEPCPKCLQSQQNQGLLRSFWTGYVQVLWSITIAIIPIVIVGFVASGAIGAIASIPASVADILDGMWAMIGVWAYLCPRILGGVLSTSAASVGLLMALTLVRKKIAAWSSRECAAATEADKAK